MGPELFSPVRRRILGSAAIAGSISLLPTKLFAQGGSDAIRPFKIHVTDEAIADLRRRIMATRWPDKETVEDDSQGVRLAKIQPLVRYWGTTYDWRKAEARLNALPQFVTSIDGLDIQFVHVRSRHANALPLIMTHGWPGSVLELVKVIAPLTDPTAHGGRAEDAFHLVLPTYPGYGWSGKPTAKGHQYRHVVLALILGRCAGRWRPVHRHRHPESPGGRDGLSLRDIPRATQLGRKEFPQAHLLERGRQGRPFRGVGTAATVQRRAARGLQVAALTGSARWSHQSLSRQLAGHGGLREIQ